jgi:hypothetical protein
MAHNDNAWLWQRYHPGENNSTAKLRTDGVTCGNYMAVLEANNLSSPLGWTDTCPQEVLKASGNILTNNHVLVHSTEATMDIYHPPEEPTQTSTPLKILSDLADTKAWATKNIILMGLAQQLVISIVASTAIAVSNGSLKD